MREYRATLGKTTRAITVAILFMLGYILMRLLTSIEQIEGRDIPLLAWALVIIVLTPVLAWLFSPKNYVLTDTELVINRRIRPRVMPYYKIADVQRLEQKMLLGNSFGIGGLFGYFGQFYMHGIGRVSYFATSRRNPILITTHSGKKYLITPDDPTMLDALQQAVAKVAVN